MASLIQFLFLKQRRCLCTRASLRVKQVSSSNFPESLEEIKTHIANSDFVAISTEKSGSPSAPSWHRVLPFDSPEIAYLKARRSAQRFQPLQFAVCPFSITDSKTLVAHPYNFLLFPRDELKMGMPCYNFSCQTTSLVSMARQGFDFNACIYNGISYLSRAQESEARIRRGTSFPSVGVMKSSSTSTFADTVFVERIRSRIKHWRKTFTNDNKDEELINSLRNIVLGNEQFRSRTCLTIDVCSERQVQLILEMLVHSHDLLPLVIPKKSGTTQAVRIVLVNSKEEKDLLKRELQSFEEEENKKIRGFREVIELISASQKPVISHNCLNDCTLIHSKFIAQLPPEVDEFVRTMCSVFPKVLDINYLMKQIGAKRKVTNIPTAISCLNSNIFTPVDLEIPDQATVNEGKIHGINALRLSYLFMKLCAILRISRNVTESGSKDLAAELADFSNVFHSCGANVQGSFDGDISVWNNNTRKVSIENLVFLWGFKSGMTARMLKSLLHASHHIFSGDFDIKLVDKSCAIVVFWKPGLSKDFIDLMNSEEISGALKELASDGMRVACYETYKTMYRLGIWEMDLAESLDRTLESSHSDIKIVSERKFCVIDWDNDNVTNFDDL